MRPVRQTPLLTNPEDRNQQEVAELLKRLLNHPLLRGTLVKARIGTSPTKVTHPLGRVPVGFLVVDTEAPVVSVGNHNAKQLVLQADADTTSTLWVF